MPIVALLPSSGSSPTDTYVGFLSRGVTFGLFSLEAPGLDARLRLCILEHVVTYSILHLVSRATSECWVWP